MSVLMLLILGKLQDQFSGNSKAWHWAAGVSLLRALMVVLSGEPLIVVVITAVLLFVYTWGYFALLRHVTDNLFLWWLVLVVGALSPLFISLIGV